MKYFKIFESGITFKKWLDLNRPKHIVFDDLPSYSYFTKINCYNSKLLDLTGIEIFKNLENLDCSRNKLTKLPEINSLINLRILFCSSNKLKELPNLSSLTKLEYLDCSYNQLTELPDLFNLLDNLKYLTCYGNKLPYSDLEGYIEWHKKMYPWKWEAKKYNL